MSEKVLFAITAIFNTPDEIIKAAEKTAENGYKKFDVNTPYPIHGMPNAMKLGRSKLGFAALVFGLSGILAALLMTFWMSAIDYPIIIGGKPYFAFPKYVPIIFEVTVLAASIGTVVTMLFFFFKFPNNSHPLHDSDYMKKVSTEKYGIYIQADDVLFNAEEIKKFLNELGAAEVGEIYWDDDEVSTSPKILEPKFLGFLAVTAIIISGTTYFGLNKLMFMVPFNWMMEQDKALPQETSNIFADGFAMRMPVEGTISRGTIPYPYYGKPELAEKLMINPLDYSEENLALGKKKYDVFCSPCHGYFGEGDSKLRGQYPNPPSIHSEKVRLWSDGRIYHVIAEGQNVMPSYSTQMTREEKWATILYIRALQRALNAKESDL
ncbi:MAG TPA: DUF3341 domain-containing protein [Ignavibacteria bacterium]|nr:DUF3341 domain-containing protein [Ignavibacteria bacterium]